MALSRVHTTAADGTFSAAGAIAWNADHGLTGADVGGIPYCPTATTEVTSANLTYTDTLVNGGPGVKIGTGAGASTGVYIGYLANGYSGLWSTGLTPSGTNYAIAQSSNGDLFLNAINGRSFTFNFSNSSKATLSSAGVFTAYSKIYPGTDGAANQAACGLYANTGAPNNANGADGDIFFRADGGASTTIYQRRAGAWVGIV